MQPLNSTLKRYALSSLTTFITTFAIVAAAELSTHTVVWSTTFWLAVGSAGVRAAIKAVIEGFAGAHADA